MTLFGKRVFVKETKLGHGHQDGPQPDVAGVFRTREETQTHMRADDKGRHTGKHYVTKKTGISVMYLQARIAKDPMVHCQQRERQGTDPPEPLRE